jgi:hypothetical protein
MAKKKMSKAMITSGEKDQIQEFNRLTDKLQIPGNSPARSDIQSLRELVVKHPELLPPGCNSHELLREEIIQRYTKEGVSRAVLLAEVDREMKALGYDTAHPLERIQLDMIVTTKLRVLVLEFHLSSALQSGDISRIDHYDQLVSSAQNRLSRAIESLSRVRRLAIQTPAIYQLNVATEGGKQLNLCATPQGSYPLSM